MQKPPIVSELDKRKTQRNKKKWRKLSLQSVESWNSSTSERQVDRMMGEKDLSSDSAFLCSSSLFEKLIIEPLRIVLLLLFAVYFLLFSLFLLCFLLFGRNDDKKEEIFTNFLENCRKSKAGLRKSKCCFFCFSDKEMLLFCFSDKQMLLFCFSDNMEGLA